LTAHRQTLAVPDAAVTINPLETLQITLYVATQITLDFDLVVRDRVNDLVQLLRRKIFRADIWIDIRLFENAPGSAKTDPIDVRQRDLDAFLRWNFNSE